MMAQMVNGARRVLVFDSGVGGLSVLDAIVAHNHQQLIDPLRPRSRYEILMAVIGVSSDSLGVPELGIRPTDSYTNDLGVD